VKALSPDELQEFVNQNIATFHESRLKRVQNIKLTEVLRKKNPYLFKAKNITLANDLMQGILDAFLSSSEEELFGQFLEDLSVFVVGKSCGGYKSAAEGIDFEFSNEGFHYIVSVKSGTNWGNSAQQKKQEANFQTALKVLKQSRHMGNVEAVLGICYGNSKTVFSKKGYRRIVGQSFWHFISGNVNLYTDIIEPLGHKAKEHNEEFVQQKDLLVNLFTQQFMDKFCEDGAINWESLVRFNSGNLKLPT